MQSKLQEPFLPIALKQVELTPLRSFTMASSGQSAWNPKDPVSEGVIYEKMLADEIGPKWKDLARALGFLQADIDSIQHDKGRDSKECCTEVLVRWLRLNGKGATAGKLVDALTKIGLKNLADKFPIEPSDTKRVSKKELVKKVSKMDNEIHKLKEEVSRLTARNEKLQDGETEEKAKVSKMDNEKKELVEKVSKRDKEINELKEEVSRLTARNEELQDGETEQKAKVSKMDNEIHKLKEEVSRLTARNEELQDGETEQKAKVSKMDNEIHKLKEEVSRLTARNEELQDGETEQKAKVSKMDNEIHELKEEVSRLTARNEELQDFETEQKAKHEKSPQSANKNLTAETTTGPDSEKSPRQKCYPHTPGRFSASQKHGKWLP
ncbi:paramyosin-like isoform X2 [Montipora foliosa]|uniref:paramyosin-like isoform X2 n=1 Tax=Montipora foliosa TaxID=591990 RepID=UPI0035F1ADFB